MLWEALLIGLIVGWLRNGKIKNLSRIPLPGWPLILIAVLIQALIWIDFSRSIYLLSSAHSILYTFSFVILVIFFFLQGKKAGFLIVGLGILLNLLVITANQGKMPVDTTKMPAEVAEELAAGEKSPFHTAITDETWLAFLGDTISLPYKKNRLLSFGDIFIAAGIIIIVQQGMQGKKRRKRWR